MRLEVTPNFVPSEDQKVLVQKVSPFCPATELHFQEALKRGETSETSKVSVIGFFEGEGEVFAVWFSVKSLVYKAVNSQAEESTAIVSDNESPFRGFLVWGPFMILDKHIYFLGRPLDLQLALNCQLEGFLPSGPTEIVRRNVIEGLRFEEVVMEKFNGLSLRWSDHDFSWRGSLLEVVEEFTGNEFSHLREAKGRLLFPLAT